MRKIFVIYIAKAGRKNTYAVIFTKFKQKEEYTSYLVNYSM